MPKLDLLGQKFGRLTAISEATKVGKRTRWLCRCDCGNEKIILTECLRSGISKSCGCYRIECTKRHRFKHGHSLNSKQISPTYNSWLRMLVRCGNPKHEKYKYYGGRGITVCPEWCGSFVAFLRDMGERPDGMTIDRIDPDGNYCKENCRWSTWIEQRANRRDSRPQPDPLQDGGALT